MSNCAIKTETQTPEASGTTAPPAEARKPLVLVKGWREQGSLATHKILI